MTRAYDALGRMTSETGPLGTVTYRWDAAGRNTRITWPDGYYAAYIYDLTGAMTQVRENGATSGAGLLAVYGYDNLGRRTSVQRRGESLADASTTFGWDGASRLINLGLNLSGTSQDATWTLGYNPAGQVVERSLSNTLYAYTAEPSLSDAYANNGLNQVTAVDSTAVGYDGRGNIIGDSQSVWNYDSRNRIVNGDATGIDIGTYSYDPAGRMWRITSGGVNSRASHARLPSRPASDQEGDGPRSAVRRSRTGCRVGRLRAGWWHGRRRWRPVPQPGPAGAPPGSHRSVRPRSGAGPDRARR